MAPGRRAVSIASSSANPFRREFVVRGDADREEVSIASSSANPFRPTPTSSSRTAGLSLNRFFLSESFPTKGGRVSMACQRKSQSLLPQRILSDVTLTDFRVLRIEVSIASSSANPFRRNYYLEEWIYYIMSQSLLPQRILSDSDKHSVQPDGVRVSIASSSANPFRRKNRKLPPGREAESQSLLPQRILSDAESPGQRGLAGDVSIASSSANPFRRIHHRGGAARCISLNRFFLSESFPTAAPLNPCAPCLCLRLFRNPSFSALPPRLPPPRRTRQNPTKPPPFNDFATYPPRHPVSPNMPSLLLSVI